MMEDYMQSMDSPSLNPRDDGLDNFRFPSGDFSMNMFDPLDMNSQENLTPMQQQSMYTQEYGNMPETFINQEETEMLMNLFHSAVDRSRSDSFHGSNNNINMSNDNGNQQLLPRQNSSSGSRLDSTEESQKLIERRVSNSTYSNTNNNNMDNSNNNNNNEKINNNALRGSGDLFSLELAKRNESKNIKKKKASKNNKSNIDELDHVKKNKRKRTDSISTGTGTDNKEMLAIAAIASSGISSSRKKNNPTKFNNAGQKEQQLQENRDSCHLRQSGNQNSPNKNNIDPQQQYNNLSNNRKGKKGRLSEEGDESDSSEESNDRKLKKKSNSRIMNNHNKDNSNDIRENNKNRSRSNSNEKNSNSSNNDGDDDEDGLHDSSSSSSANSSRRESMDQTNYVVASKTIGNNAQKTNDRVLNNSEFDTATATINTTTTTTTTNVSNSNNNIKNRVNRNVVFVPKVTLGKQIDPRHFRNFRNDNMNINNEEGSDESAGDTTIFNSNESNTSKNNINVHSNDSSRSSATAKSKGISILIQCEMDPHKTVRNLYQEKMLRSQQQIAMLQSQLRKQGHAPPHVSINTTQSFSVDKGVVPSLISPVNNNNGKQKKNNIDQPFNQKQQLKQFRQSSSMQQSPQSGGIIRSHQPSSMNTSSVNTSIMFNRSRMFYGGQYTPPLLQQQQLPPAAPYLQQQVPHSTYHNHQQQPLNTMGHVYNNSNRWSVPQPSSSYSQIGKPYYSQTHHNNNYNNYNNNNKKNSNASMPRSSSSTSLTYLSSRESSRNSGNDVTPESLQTMNNLYEQESNPMLKRFLKQQQQASESKSVSRQQQVYGSMNGSSIDGSDANNTTRLSHSFVDKTRISISNNSGPPSNTSSSEGRSKSYLPLHGNTGRHVPFLGNEIPSTRAMENARRQIHNANNNRKSPFLDNDELNHQSMGSSRSQSQASDRQHYLQMQSFNNINTTPINVQYVNSYNTQQRRVSSNPV